MFDDRAYATDNGFYVGDEVVYDGKETIIEYIVSKGHKTWLFDGTRYYLAPCSMVKLKDGRVTLDVKLTRIG